MFPLLFILVLLSILLNSTPANALGVLPVPPSKPNNADTRNGTFCLPPSSPWSAIITFTPTSTNLNDTTIYGIRTGYTHFYPQTLSTALKAAGFSTTAHQLDGNHECGWHMAGSVFYASPIMFGAGDYRGDIYWRPQGTDIDIAAYPSWLDVGNNTSNYTNYHARDNKTMDVGTPLSRMPNSQPHLPTASSLTTIVSVLRTNIPAADVFEHSTQVLGCLFGVVSGVLGFLLAQYCRVCMRQKSDHGAKDWDDMEEIELADMRRVGPEDVEDRFKCIPKVEQVKHGYVSEGGGTPAATVQFEELPVYSVDGTGC